MKHVWRREHISDCGAICRAVSWRAPWSAPQHCMGAGTDLLYTGRAGLGREKRERGEGAQCGEGSHALHGAVGAGVAPGAGDGAREEVAAAVEQAQRAQVGPAGGQRPCQCVVAQRQVLHQRGRAPPGGQRACAQNTTKPIRCIPALTFRILTTQGCRVSDPCHTQVLESMPLTACLKIGVTDTGR